MASKKILITGGAGFIGSHLCEKLLDGGNEIICLDNLFTGSKDNIRHLLSNPYFEFVRHDVLEKISIECDEIYHLACPASPVFYQKDPVKTGQTNVLGSINMLELARKSHAKILLASTSEIYGNPLVHPQPESYWGNVNPIGVRSCYDEGKRMAETLFFDFHHQYGVDIRVVRIFNTYGPKMQLDDGRVVSNFIVQALTKQPITIYGSGNQTRSFCYVDDLVCALVKMMDNPQDFIGPVNLGNPCEFTIFELAQKVLSLTGSDSEIIYEPLPKDDPVQRQPIIDLAKKELDWSPKIQLDEGLQKTISYFEKMI